MENFVNFNNLRNLLLFFVMALFLGACGTGGDGFRGDVRFKPPVTYPTGSKPQAIIQGDFDDDGYGDFVIANEDDNSLTLFFGDGTGAFPDIVLLPLSLGEEGPKALAKGYFNDDGIVNGIKIDIDDIAVVNLKSGSISIILGKKDRSFIAPIEGTIGVGVAPRAIAVGDFDGMFADDLAVVNSGDSQTPGSISVLLGDGVSFDPRPTNKSVDYKGLFAIVSGTFNSDIDDLSDIVVLDQEAGAVFILLGFDIHGGTGPIIDSQGDFLPPIAFPVGSGPSDLTSGDFNGDGKLDVVVVNSQDLTLSVLLGVGDGSFETLTTELEGVLPFSIESGDINGDGNLDVAIVDLLNHTVSVLLGIGKGEFGLQNFFSTGDAPISVILADVNGDLKLDMAVSNSGNDTVSVFLNDL